MLLVQLVRKVGTVFIHTIDWSHIF